MRTSAAQPERRQDASDQIDVVVATYRRPDALRDCLTALRRQSHAPARVVVVVREGDEPSRTVALEPGSPVEIQVVGVDEPGVVAALTAGVRATTAPVVAFTDDDAVPRVDWLQQMAAAMADPAVAAIGGRDVIPGETTPLTDDVGRLTWFGRLVGNHHLGAGRARSVDVLKGVNMAIRASALALPRAGVLRGAGAQPHFEVLACLWAGRAGRVVYDPRILVDHRPRERYDSDRRGRPAASAVVDVAHNFLVATTLLERRLLVRHAVYAFGFGSRQSPGLLRTAVAVVRREWDVVGRAAPAAAGHALAVGRVIRARSADAMVECEALRPGRRGTVAA